LKHGSGCDFGLRGAILPYANYQLEIGQVLEVIADDGGIQADMPAWCKSTGNEFLGLEEEDGEYRVYVRKLKV
jgi:TusA-related sulfurtransferase